MLGKFELWGSEQLQILAGLSTLCWWWADSCQLLHSLFLLLCVEAGQQLRWGKRRLCSVVVLCPRTHVTDIFVWIEQPKVCQLSDGCSVWLLVVVWLCCHSLFRGWSQAQWLLAGFFSVSTRHPCPSIIKPTLTWLVGAYSKAWWKQGLVVGQRGHWGIGCVSRSAGGLSTG